jgi:hypothetical protein
MFYPNPKSPIVMAGLVPAIHFPEALQALHRLWKMDGVRTLSLRTKGGHDDGGTRK